MTSVRVLDHTTHAHCRLHTFCFLCYRPEHTCSLCQGRSQSVGCAAISAVVGTAVLSRITTAVLLGCNAVQCGTMQLQCSCNAV